MAAKDEDGGDGILAGLRDMAQELEEIFSDPLRSQETSNEEKGTSNHQLAALSTTYNILDAYMKSETRNVSVISGEAVPFSSSSDLTNVLRPPPPIMISPSGQPMADVVKRSLGLSLKPIKNDPSLYEKSDATKPSSNAYTESDAKRDQHGDSDVAFKYNLPDDEEVTNPIDYTSSEFDAVRDQLQEHFPKAFLESPDVKCKRQDPLSSAVTSLKRLSIENDDSEYLAHDASLQQYLSKIDSSSSDHLEAEQAQYETHEHASDFTFDVRQPVNPAQAPPKPLLQRQNAMVQQRYTRELDPGYSASSLTTASSPGPRPPISMTKALTTSTDFVPQRNQQAMNPHYTQHQVPSGQYGNMTNSPYSLPNQNERYNMPPSAAAFQQHGGSNNNTLAHNGTMVTSPYWRPEQNDSYNMPQLAASVVPYAYGSANPFGYEGGVSSNHLESVQHHQSGDSNVWPPSSRSSRQQQQQ